MQQTALRKQKHKIRRQEAKKRMQDFRQQVHNRIVGLPNGCPFTMSDRQERLNKGWMRDKMENTLIAHVDKVDDIPPLINQVPLLLQKANPRIGVLAGMGISKDISADNHDQEYREVTSYISPLQAQLLMQQQAVRTLDQNIDANKSHKPMILFLRELIVDSTPYGMANNKTFLEEIEEARKLAIDGQTLLLQTCNEILRETIARVYGNVVVPLPPPQETRAPSTQTAPQAPKGRRLKKAQN